MSYIDNEKIRIDFLGLFVLSDDHRDDIVLVYRVSDLQFFICVWIVEDAVSFHCLALV